VFQNSSAVFKDGVGEVFFFSSDSQHSYVDVALIIVIVDFYKMKTV
jgi:hypothetical protein